MCETWPFSGVEYLATQAVFVDIYYKKYESERLFPGYFTFLIFYPFDLISEAAVYFMVYYY